jgi:hypothetical protein
MSSQQLTPRRATIHWHEPHLPASAWRRRGITPRFVSDGVGRAHGARQVPEVYRAKIARPAPRAAVEQTESSREP